MKFPPEMIPDQPETLPAMLLQSVAALGQDKAQLERRLGEKDAALLEKEAQLNEKDALIAKQEAQLKLLYEQLRLLKHHRFGASSERLEAATGQGELFNECEIEAADAAPAEAAVTEQKPEEQAAIDSAKPQRGRRALPPELPRVTVLHDLPGEEKTCQCGCQLTEIGEETSEQLDVVPMQIRVLRHVRKKYACRACEEGVHTAPLPPQPLPKSNASPALLAWLIVAKYVDGLPLYRLENGFARLRVALSRATQANWMIGCASLFEPLLKLLVEAYENGPVAHIDETVVQVLKEADRPAQSQSYMWVRSGGPPGQRVVLFDYAPSRSGEVAMRLLENVGGAVMSDGYAAYNSVCTLHGQAHLGCWAHARRRFFEAVKALPPEQQKATTRAHVGLNYVRKLYAIESEIKDLPPEAKYRVRQARSVPLLTGFKTWAEKAVAGGLLPSGKLGQAIEYLLRQWPKLVRYCESGTYPIDNNAAENAIRPFVIGRKNWLFSDTPKGAHASAALYSVVETAKANGLEPHAYVLHVLKNLPAATSVAEMEKLLPWNCRDVLGGGGN